MTEFSYRYFRKLAKIGAGYSNYERRAADFESSLQLLRYSQAESITEINALSDELQMLRVRNAQINSDNEALQLRNSEIDAVNRELHAELNQLVVENKSLGSRFHNLKHLPSQSQAKESWRAVRLINTVDAAAKTPANSAISAAECLPQNIDNNDKSVAKLTSSRGNSRKSKKPDDQEALVDASATQVWQGPMPKAWYGAMPLSRECISPYYTVGIGNYDAETSVIAGRYGGDLPDEQSADLHRLLGSDDIVRSLFLSVKPNEVECRIGNHGFSLITLYHSHRYAFHDCARSVGRMLDVTMAKHPDTAFEWLIVNDDPQMEDSELLSYVPTRLMKYVTLLSDGCNKGISVRSNEAIIASKYHWLLFLDCDDMLIETAINVLLHYTKIFHYARYICSTIEDIENSGNFLRNRIHTNMTTDMFGRGMLAGHLKAIRRDLFADIGNFKPEFDGVQDYDFALRTAAVEPILQIPERLYKYRWHAKSQSVGQRVRQLRRTRAVRVAFLRNLLAAPDQEPLDIAPLPDDPRVATLIRTEGRDLDALGLTLRSVLDHSPTLIPCVIVQAHNAALSKSVSDWLGSRFANDIIFLGIENGELSGGFAFNVALRFLVERHIKYDFVTFLEEGDILLPDFAKDLLDAAHFEHADVVYGLNNARDINGKVRDGNLVLPPCILCSQNFLLGCNFIVRSSLLTDERVRFSVTVGNQYIWDFLLKLLDMGANLVPISGAVSISRGNDLGSAIEDGPELIALIRRASQIAGKLGPKVFWRDILNFPEDRFGWLEGNIEAFESAKKLFLGTKA